MTVENNSVRRRLSSLISKNLHSPRGAIITIRRAAASKSAAIRPQKAYVAFPLLIRLPAQPRAASALWRDCVRLAARPWAVGRRGENFRGGGGGRHSVSG